jgi:hypothetical protein
MISEILDHVSKAETEAEKIKILRKNYSPALEDVFHWAYNPNITLFTNEVPPYTPDASPEGLSLTSIYSEHKRFYMFLRNTQIDPARKRILLIQMLEALGPKEAKIVECIVKRNIPQISKDIAEKAYPGFFEQTY